MRQFFLIFILTLSSFSYANISECGFDEADRAYASLDWTQAAYYEVNTIYADINAIVCTGINFETLEIERIHYRDNSGVKRNYSLSELKQKDIPFLRRTDFPSAARIVTRNIDPLTLKVLNGSLINGKREYSLSFKFVRNMAKGFSATDIRDLQIKLILSNNSNRGLTAIFNKNKTKTEFNGLKLNISSGLSITTIEFLDDNLSLRSENSFDLPKAKRQN